MDTRRREARTDVVIGRGSRERVHVADLAVEGEVIVSGGLSAPVVHASEHVSIGDGDDGSLWIVVHDPQRRPRGRDPGIVVEAADVAYEENGLVRVLDRRIARDALERLVEDLTGNAERIAGSLSHRSRIPDGDYDGMVVQSIEPHYRVTVRDRRMARRMADMQPLGENRWLVVAGDESRLRRELVDHLMPVAHRTLWAATNHGEKILLVLGVALAALSLVVPALAPLAVLAAVALGLFHHRRGAIVAAVRRRLVQPCIERTMERQAEARADEDVAHDRWRGSRSGAA